VEIVTESPVWLGAVGAFSGSMDEDGMETKLMERRRWYGHPVGFGRKASSQLSEGFLALHSEIPRVGGRGAEGKCGRPEYSIHIATTATTHSDDSFTNPSVDSGHIVFSNMFLQVNPIIILPPFNF
jgi:hypothetical protein